MCNRCGNSSIFGTIIVLATILVILNLAVNSIILNILYQTEGIGEKCYDLAKENGYVIQTVRRCSPFSCGNVNNLDNRITLINNLTFKPMVECYNTNFYPYTETGNFGSYAEFELIRRGGKE